MCFTICAIIVSGVLTSVLWHYLEQRENIEIPPAKSWSDPELFRFEYEQLSEGIRSRDRVTIIAGTILIAASILLLGTNIELRSRNMIDLQIQTLLIFTSLTIYIIWLICFNQTSGKLDHISYRRLEKMEESELGKEEGEKRVRPEELKCGIHHYIRKQIENKWWYNYLRRPVWLYFFWVLVTVSITILSSPI